MSKVKPYMGNRGKMTSAQARAAARVCIADLQRMRDAPAADSNEAETAYQLGWCIGTLQLIAGTKLIYREPGQS